MRLAAAQNNRTPNWLAAGGVMLIVLLFWHVNSLSSRVWTLEATQYQQQQEQSSASSTAAADNKDESWRDRLYNLEQRVVQYEEMLRKQASNKISNMATSVVNTATRFTQEQPPSPIFMSHATSAEILKTVSEREMNQYVHFYRSLTIPPLPIELSGNDIVIDIGANLGKFTRSVRNVCSSCTIVSFEAVPNYAAYIVFQSKRGEKTYVVPKGLSTSNGPATFLLDTSNLGWNTLVESMGGEGMKKVQVDLVKLDDVDLSSVLDTSKVKLIKIDTEGAECFVLAGAHNFLKTLKPRPTLLIEVAWGAHENPNWELVKREFEWLFANGWHRVNYDSIFSTQDIIVHPDNSAKQ